MGFYEFMNEVVFAFLEGIVLLLLFTFFVDKRDFLFKDRIKSFVYLTVYTILSYWATKYLPPGFHTIFLSVTCILLLSFITRTNIFASTIAFAALMVGLFIVEASILVVEMLALKIDIGILSTDPGYKLLSGVFVRSAELGIIMFLFRTKFKFIKHDFLKKGNSPLAFMILNMFIISAFIVSISYVTSRQVNGIVYNTLLLIIYVILLVLSFYEMKEREHILKTQSKFHIQEEHVKNLEHVIDFIRKEKHDYANHLNTILAMGALNKPDLAQKLVSYVSGLANNLNSSYQFYNSGNDYIDGLLAVKSNAADEKGISFRVNFEASLSQVRIADSDLTSIVGNIVDNAFEAMSGKVDGESKVVSISSYVDENKYYLFITNNGPSIPEKALEKIFESGFSTKTDNKADHGYGLYIVKQMVERNGGEITVVSNEEETVFEVEFGVATTSKITVS